MSPIHSPPKIIHIQRPYFYLSMAADACTNVKLSGVPTKLFLYYASQATGFRPSLLEISKHTGIRPNKISEHRKILEQRTLIRYLKNDSKSKIIINWKQIRLFAALSEPLPFHRNNKDRCHFSHLHIRGLEKTIADLGQKYHLLYADGEERPCLSKVHISFIETVEQMTEREYHIWMKAFPGYTIDKLTTQDFMNEEELNSSTFPELFDGISPEEFRIWVASIPNELPF